MVVALTTATIIIAWPVTVHGPAAPILGAVPLDMPLYVADEAAAFTELTRASILR